MVAIRPTIHDAIRPTIYSPVASKWGLSLAAQLDAQTAAGLHAFRLKLSDLSSLYLDDQAVGGNVSADAETVGLVLDKAQMDGKTADAFITAQPELVSNSGNPFTATTGYTTVNASLSVVDGKIRVTGAGVAPRALFAITTVVGRRTKITTTVSNNATANFLIGASNNSDGSSAFAVTAASAQGDLEIDFVPTATTTYIFVRHDTTNAIFDFSFLSAKELPGVHFLNATTAKEPAFKKAPKANADVSSEPELAPNPGGPFTSTDDMSAGNSATISLESGRIRVTNTVSYGYVHFPIATVVGQPTRVTIEGYAGNAAWRPRVGTSPGGNTNYQGGTSGGDATLEFDFTPTATTSYVSIFCQSVTVDDYIEVGAVSAKTIPASQLYNVLRGDGTDDLLTGSPFAYANGSAAFVFGVKGTVDVSDWIFGEGNSNNANPFYGLASGAVDSGKLRLAARNDANTTLISSADTTVDVFDGDPHVVVVIDTGSSYSYRVDGADAGSGSYTRSGTLTLDVTSLLALKRNTEGNWAAADICDEFIVFEPGWTAAQIATAEAKIAQALGVTLS